MRSVRCLSALALVLALSAPSLAQEKTAALPLAKGPRFAVRIDSSPQQASIYINGKEYGIQGYTPSTLKLPKGPYKLILELPGFRSTETNITVTGAHAFTVTLERQARPGIVDVRSGSDQSALGATIIVDGTTVGTAPNQVEVSSGVHLLEVKKPGFIDYRESVPVAEGERRTMVVTMVAQVKPGSLLITADLPGAQVLVDGVPKDTAPAMIGDLPEGPHTVEVRSGQQSWKQVVIVVAGQQVKVAATLAPPPPVAPPAPTAGSIKVLSGTPMADVFVDGEAKGPANAEIANVRPGTHILEVRAHGYAPRRSEVQVVAGEMRVVSLDLFPAEADKPATAKLRVISPVPDVEVFIDGASIGRAPVERSDLLPGKHFVMARRSGYAQFRTEVDLAAGSSRELAVDLRAVGTLKVISNISDADVILDGTLAGKTPLSLTDVAAGDHIVEVRLKDYVDVRKTVRIESDQQQLVQADLQTVSHAPTVSDVEQTVRGQSSFGGTTIDRSHVNIDLGAGHPYFGFVRAIVGIGRLHERGVLKLGLDIGIELRTNYYFTDIGLRPRLQIIRVDPFAMSFDIFLAGGFGPNKRNSFTFEMGPTLTLIAGRYVHINLKPYLMFTTDRLCPSVESIAESDMTDGKTTGPATKPVVTPGSGSLYSAEEVVCKVDDGKRGGMYPADLPDASKTLAMHASAGNIGQKDPRERFADTRFMLQGSVEIAVLKNLNLWGLVEGAPGMPQRQTFRSHFDPAFADTDWLFYFRAGVSLKF